MTINVWSKCNMTQPTNYKFHSTGQFRNVVRSIKEQATFVGVDESGK